MEQSSDGRGGEGLKKGIGVGEWIKIGAMGPVVEVEKVEPVGEFLRVLGREVGKVGKGRYLEHLLTAEGEPLPGGEGGRLIPITPTFTGDREEIFLGLEGYRFKLVFQQDELVFRRLPNVDPLPHQLEAVYSYILNLPQIRFLVADDPGAGKTIIGGLVIKELLISRGAQRILIVVPGHLKEQWRRELEEKFGERFTIVDRHYLQHSRSRNPFQERNLIITSIDFAKRKENLERLKGLYFDLIIVDEAHKMHASVVNKKVEKSQRYKLGELLSQIGYHLLFLTATPHDGNPESFRLFLKLLRPDLITPDFPISNLTSLNPPIMLRRLKEDLRDFSGRPLFKPREVRTLPFEIGEREVKLYNRLSHYIQTQYNRALSNLNRQKRRNVAFALIILQRRFASSVYALLHSLLRRKERLERLKREIGRGREGGGERGEELPPIGEMLEEVEELEERERWQKEEEWEGVTASQTRGELEREIEELEGLIELAREILGGEGEVKLQQLKESLEWLSREFPGKKVIIFTESKDTLFYLEEKLKGWGYSVAVIHGGMSMGERRWAEELFRRERQILVATEAAGEGINLQFCNLMINYDIPWNPTRLEQRMGRIHRYGQREVVHIYNLVAKNTREGVVLERLLEKLRNIRDALGSDKVFDVISEIFEGEKLSKLLMEAVVNSKPQPTLLQELEEGEEQKIVQLRRQLQQRLGRKLPGDWVIDRMIEEQLEQKLDPEYLEAFFKRGYRKLGGKVLERGEGVLEILTIPAPLYQIGAQQEFYREFGPFPTPPFLATFDLPTARASGELQFLSFGHPLFEALLAYFQRRGTLHFPTGGLFLDPDRRLDGFVVVFHGVITDGKGKVAGEKLIPVFVDRKKLEPEKLPENFLWDLKPASPAELFPSPLPSEGLKEILKRGVPVALSTLTSYLERIRVRRHRVGKMKKRQLEGLHRSLNLVNRQVQELEELSKREGILPPAYQPLLWQRAHRINNYLTQRRELEQEQQLFLEKPGIVTILQVVPMPEGEREEKGGEGGMRSDREIEKIGMEVAMEFERREGRSPEDVSAQNLGFDIRSWEVGPSGRRRVARYIEVKARAREGEVALTPNEWFKAHRFREKYYLYVVLNAATTPELIVIQNPAEKLKPVEKVVRYICPLATILEKGEVKWLKSQESLPGKRERGEPPPSERGREWGDK